MAGLFGVNLSEIPADIMTQLRSVPQGIAGDISHLFAAPGSVAGTAGQGATAPASAAVGAQPQASQGIVGAPPIPDASIVQPYPIAAAQAQVMPSQGVAPRPVGPISMQPTGQPGADHMATLGQFHALMQQLSPGWGQ